MFINQSLPRSESIHGEAFEERAFRLRELHHCASKSGLLFQAHVDYPVPPEHRGRVCLKGVLKQYLVVGQSVQRQMAVDCKRVEGLADVRLHVEHDLSFPLKLIAVALGSDVTRVSGDLNEMDLKRLINLILCINL